MKIKILASASRDLMEGYRFYERQAEGVGAYFLDSLLNAAEWDVQNIAEANVHAARGIALREQGVGGVNSALRVTG